MNRRGFARIAAVLGALSPMAQGRAQAADQTEPTKATAEAHHLEAMQRHASLLDGPRLSIGMLVYPGMYLQDLVGPLTVFESLLNRDIHLLWKDLEPVGSEGPTQTALIPVKPTTTLDACPATLDVLFVPGGVPGTFTMMEDPQVLAFLADRGQRARFVTSVCTGSLILGAAGLLKGYKATSYWSTREVLRELGAIPTPGRVVVDRNRITGGGVTAGLDFGLSVVAELRSKAYAQAVQLYLEYDPAPPFDAGSPEKAPKPVKAFLDDMFGGMVQTAHATARRAWRRLG